MQYYTEYNNTYDNNDDSIYTFDIETSSIFLDKKTVYKVGDLDA